MGVVGAKLRLITWGKNHNRGLIGLFKKNGRIFHRLSRDFPTQSGVPNYSNLQPYAPGGAFEKALARAIISVGQDSALQCEYGCK
jgi:hypothetical protein